MIRTLQNLLELPGASASLRTMMYFDLLLFYIELDDRPAAKLEICKRYLQAASEYDVDSFELSFVERNAMWSYDEVYESSITVAEFRAILMKWTTEKVFSNEQSEI